MRRSGLFLFQIHRYTALFRNASINVNISYSYAAVMSRPGAREDAEVTSHRGAGEVAEASVHSAVLRNAFVFE